MADLIYTCRLNTVVVCSCSITLCSVKYNTIAFRFPYKNKVLEVLIYLKRYVLKRTFGLYYSSS